MLVAREVGIAYGRDMKILLATPLYPPEIGGPATYAKILHDELPKQGHTLHIVRFGRVRHLPSGIRHLVYFFMLLRHVLGSDVVYALDPVSVGAPAALAAWFFRKPFLLKVVGDFAWEQFQNQKSRIKNQNDDARFIDPIEFQNGNYDWRTELHRKIERWVARRAACIIVPSEYLKKVVAAWGVAPERIVVIPNAFEGVSEVGNRDALRAMMGFSGTMLVSAGRLVPWKGFEVLIEVMPEVVERVPDAKLIIAGEGPEQEQLERLIEELGLKERVVLTGALRQDVLHSYIRAADLFVLNTGYEGFSHQLLEVMALGTPVVTTDAGGNPELITSGTEGLLVPFNDRAQLREGVITALTSKQKAAQWARAAQQRAGAFTLERMLTGLEQALRNVR